jgi:hypothetical protein
MQYVNCKFGISCGNLPEHTPAAYLGHSMHFYDQAPRPPLNHITQQGCQLTGLELRFPKYI